MLEILTKNSGAYGHTCCGHSMQPDFTKTLVSLPKCSFVHDIKNFKSIYNSSKHCVLAMEMGQPFAWFVAGQTSRIVERRWQKLFADPSQWWDSRSEKVNPKYPDFKHKSTQEGLWVDSTFTPQWVKAGLAAMEPGTVQLNLFSTNRRLARLIQEKQYEKTLELFHQMQESSLRPDRFTFIPVLNAIASLQALEEGRRIHAKIIQNGFDADICISNSLIDMYGKCGSIEDARIVFNKMPTRDVIAWSALIKGYVRCGHGQNALDLSKQMEQEGITSDCVAFIAILNACASVAALEEGRLIHRRIVERGFESHVFVGSSLVDMYAKCGSIEDAQRVFEKMPTRDVASWNAMIQGYVKCGQGEKALTLSKQMRQDGVELDPVTFVAMLNACASLVALEEGRNIHQQIIQRGFKSNAFVGSSLIDMYAKCGSIEEAWGAFNKMPVRNVVAWNAMILGFVKCGQGLRALELFKQMQTKGINPEALTFVGVLNACASMHALEEGRGVHRQIIQRGLELDDFVGSSLIDMYTKCGSIEDAWIVFKKMPEHDVVAWSAMMQGYVKCGQGLRALELSRQMLSEGVEPDSVAFVGMLNACASAVALEEGRQIHKRIIEKGYESDLFVSNSLMDMYAKCGCIDEAQHVFSKMPKRDAISWTTMLGGYAIHGHGKDALEHFKQMCQEDVEMSKVSFVSLLTACSHAGLVNEGLQYFESMSLVYNVPATVEHYACLVNLLGRAGHLEDAEDVIWSMACEPDVTVYRALLSACRVYGNVEMAERIAKQIVEFHLQNASDHVLLSNIYAAVGKWESSTIVRRQMHVD